MYRGAVLGIESVCLQRCLTHLGLKQFDAALSSNMSFFAVHEYLDLGNCCTTVPLVTAVQHLDCLSFG